MWEIIEPFLLTTGVVATAGAAVLLVWWALRVRGGN